MQRQTRLLDNCCLKEIKDDHRFYPTKEEQKRLEVYKDLGQEVLSEYNENF